MGTAARCAADLGADVMVSDLPAPEAAAEFVRARGRESEVSVLDTDRRAVEAWADGCGAVDALIDRAAIRPFDTESYLKVQGPYPTETAIR